MVTTGWVCLCSGNGQRCFHENKSVASAVLATTHNGRVSRIWTGLRTGIRGRGILCLRSLSMGSLALMHGPSEVASVSRRGGMVLGRLALFPKATCASRRNRNDIQERDAIQARAIAWRTRVQISPTWLMATVSDFSAEPRISLVPHSTPEGPSLSPICPESGALVLVWPRARLNFELVHRRTASRSKKVGSSDDDGSTSGIGPAPTTPTPATPARRAFDQYQTAVGPGQKCLGRFWTR